MSLLHIFKHHYITQVRVLDDRSYTRQISLRFQFPHDSDKYADDIIDWVTTELQHQCQLTQEILRPTGLSWEQEIDVQRVPDLRFIRDRLPQVAMSYLGKETHERRLINRDELIAKLKVYLKNPPPIPEVVVIWGKKDSDMRYILEWLVAACECQSEITTCQLDFEPELNRGESYIIMETKPLLARDTRGILLISNLQNAQTDVQSWLWANRLPQAIEPIKGRRNVAIVLWEGEQPDLPDIPFLTQFFELCPFREKQVEDHLVQKRAYPPEQAPNAARLVSPNSTPPGEVISRISSAFE